MNKLLAAGAVVAGIFPGAVFANPAEVCPADTHEILSLSSGQQDTAKTHSLVLCMGNEVEKLVKTTFAQWHGVSFTIAIPGGPDGAEERLTLRAVEANDFTDMSLRVLDLLDKSSHESFSLRLYAPKGDPSLKGTFLMSKRPVPGQQNKWTVTVTPVVK